MMIACVVSSGPQTTVQDAGRVGLRHLGIPLSGAADRISLALSNVALGNPWDAPALECTLGGLVLEFTENTTIALGGADMVAALNDAPVLYYEPISVSKGDQLKLGQARIGMRCYIAFGGGVAGNNFLGSVSTHLPAHLGGIDGRALKAGDQIHSAEQPVGQPNDIPPYLRTTISHDWFLRALPGPEYETFSDESRGRFFSQKFAVDRRADRMGVRLTGRTIQTPEMPPMKSSAVFPGTIQCPPDGAPFLLLSDAQTLGGYPRIAHLVDADVPLTGQIRPGDHVWFIKTTPQVAHEISMQRRAFFDSILPEFSFT